jgi:8-oxo-dGTP pyrophosphatase MutT (NUDIX family)
MQKKPSSFYFQSAVIPYVRVNQETKILLITTRKKKKWTLPKGIVESNLSPEESALKEAYEEAGIEGKIPNGLLDVFYYNKWGGTCKVEVFSMPITVCYEDWPEKNLRSRELFPVSEAIQAIGRKEIKPVLEKFKEKNNL